VGAHVSILQLENVAYSKLSEIFVNDLSHNGKLRPRIPLKEKVLRLDDGLQSGCQRGVAQASLCGKAEDGRG
jgi:hypothetical protein